jgi:hypothetical protein
VSNLSDGFDCKGFGFVQHLVKIFYCVKS